MKLLAVDVTRTYRLYAKDSGGFHVAVWDREQDFITRFSLDITGKLKHVKCENLSQLNQDAIKWAQYTLSTGKMDKTTLC